ncbi:MAG: hypothetical protein FJ115_07030 [Deltaproteobacteria bacterium]|nr:hypothetical protein [Deltaproteobacteria bacterium]MBM4323294.1 hypothetical protein [Deltaproteobacteria bacterium]
MDKKLHFRMIGAILILCILFACSRPQKSGFDSDEIDTSRDPIQGSTASHEPIVIETKEGDYTLTPMAEYQLAGKVVSKETYSYGWETKISPLDLAIVWGKLAEPEYETYVSFRQGNRWYFYEYKPECPLDNDYILSHSSNNHIIPATENISLALKGVAKNEKIILEGFLVNLRGTYKGGTVYWNTSLTRKDTGNGSCELFYVMKARINTDVYE